MSEDYVNTPVSHWTITGDVEVPMIQSISGISESNAVEGPRSRTAQGNPNRPKWWSRATTYGDVTLQRVLDTDQVFADWRKEVKEGDAAAKKALTITAMTASTSRTSPCAAWKGRGPRRCRSPGWSPVPTPSRTR